MVNKGTLLGEKRVVLKRHENSYNNKQVRQALRVSEFDLDGNIPVIVELYCDGREENAPNVEYQTEIHKSGNTLTVPTKIIEELDLRPGETIDIKIFDPPISESGEKDITEFIDSEDVIARTTANANSTHRTGCDSRMTSEAAVEYINEVGGRTKVQFHNSRTGKTVEGVTHANYDSERDSFYFPSEVRIQTDTQPGDLIEVLPSTSEIDTEESDTQDQDTREVPEEIAEMHEMITELYEAYLEAND